MAVNTLGMEQIYTLINSIHAQATGSTTIQATDLSTFISVAQETLQTGYDNTIGAISQVLNRTIYAVRPYDEKFKGLEYSAERWGGITRKINYADTQALAELTYGLTDGYSVDQYIVKNPKVLETHYYGSDVYKGQYTIYTRQLDEAFRNPEEFGSFISGLMTHFANERTQWLENLKRMILVNGITAKLDMAQDVVHLLTEYNTATGLSLTATTVMQPANFDGFMKWMFARVSNISRLMTERSELFQQVITGYAINRHTPMEDQRIYLDNQLLDGMTARVLADTYHDNFLTYSDVEGVNYWQSIKAPRSVSAKPVYVDSAGAVKIATGNVTDSAIVGIMFDRDAMGYNIYQDSLETSPYNADGQYYNLFHHVRVQLQNDVTEKIVVLALD